MICKHFINNIFKQVCAHFLHTVKQFQVLLCITNNLIKHQSFVYTLLKYQTVLFDREIGPYQMLPVKARVDLGAIARKSTLHSLKHQHYWSLTIRLFSVISRHSLEGLPFCRDKVGVFYRPSQCGLKKMK